MENMKFRIDGPAQSEALQNVLFGLGYFWANTCPKSIENQRARFIYTAYDGSLLADNSGFYFDWRTDEEQNTAEFILKHTMKANMTNSNTATELMFDINADISRQYTRDGRKMLSIFDSGLDIEYPISAIIDGNQGAQCYTKSGEYYSGNMSNDDIITRTIEKPLIVGFTNIYPDGFADCYTTKNNAVYEAMSGLICTVKITFNPNDNSVSAEIASE